MAGDARNFISGQIKLLQLGRRREAVGGDFEGVVVDGRDQVPCEVQRGQLKKRRKKYLVKIYLTKKVSWKYKWRTSNRRTPINLACFSFFPNQRALFIKKIKTSVSLKKHNVSE